MSEDEFVWSINGEDFNHQEKGDAIDECVGDGGGVGSVIYCGKKKEIDPAKLCTAEDVLERLADAAWDYAGEYSDGYPDVSQDAKQELQNLLEAWIRKHCTPTFYGVKDVQEYTLTSDDVQGSESCPLPN